MDKPGLKAALGRFADSMDGKQWRKFVSVLMHASRFLRTLTEEQQFRFADLATTLVWPARDGTAPGWKSRNEALATLNPTDREEILDALRERKEWNDMRERAIRT